MEASTTFACLATVFVGFCLLSMCGFGDWMHGVATSITVNLAHFVQRTIPSSTLVFEFLTITLEFGRNMTSLLPHKNLFWFMNGLFRLCMKCMYTYGAEKGKFDRIVELQEDVFLLRYVNLYFLGTQITESALFRTEKQVILYGVCALSPEIEELIGDRDIVVVLQLEHHHKWLSVFMDRYPAATIAGSRVGLQKHMDQTGRSFRYTPLEQIVFPSNMHIAKVPGVADEEYLLLHRDLKVLFSAHFFANPHIFVGIQSYGWFLKKALEWVLYSSRCIESWDGMPTDNPVFDRGALDRFKEEMRLQGTWTRIHSSHAGMLVPPAFEGSTLCK
eukprot:TRINITY_DN7059_c0_g1_i4.p1 TRINITY_DN7059_c0_g1~~TRINITY_DN7059_c0_g1_i4.p1  ORF type:complete len:356 (-),score=49.26 TRINITY_DN7059_c0_g1_i4:267-1259(-)